VYTLGRVGHVTKLQLFWWRLRRLYRPHGDALGEVSTVTDRDGHTDPRSGPWLVGDVVGCSVRCHIG
jgi:hypothetical protein